ncbi:Protein required for ethanol metabolism [Irineochytrium annulatum]|nr:Protein required for ethanol metabolism [Irineochytrium annulatum]
MIFRAYHTYLHRHPILVQSLSTGALFGLGDVIAQQAVDRKGKDHDFFRTARLMAFGGCLAGPCVAVWYPFLQKSVTAANPTANLLLRVAGDQLLFAPLFIGIFFGATGFMEGKSVDEVKDRLEKGYLPALYNNWKLWPAVQLVNFAFVPILYRSLVVNVVATGWNTYLSVAMSRLTPAAPKLEKALHFQGVMEDLFTHAPV